MKLDLSRIPPELHHLISLVEKYAVFDDWIREDLVRNLSPEEKRALQRAVNECDDAFDLWLAGPEASGPSYSQEYIAFSILRMVADSM
ncbi:hypothetical protein [Telluria beijingensis]|uniref:hypothetical protein n=1 Tax=Telluria beijingensis TaxID=3068633 RepID=UPI0027956A52|nr:hypothetical protein [Massilia sp. REN29]